MMDVQQKLSGVTHSHLKLKKHIVNKKQIRYNNHKERGTNMVEKIFTIILSVIIILSAILIGSPLKNNIAIINCIISILTIGYIIWNSKKNKEKIITNKIDIFVIIYAISSCIPLIFGTYISQEQTVLSILQSISILDVYFLMKRFNNKHIENAILLSSIIILIFGIDNLTTNIFENALINLGILKIINTEKRLISNIGYANTTAIIMAVSLFISLGKILNSNSKKEKAIYSFANFCYIAGIILAVSKGTMISFVIFFFAYMFLLNNKQKRIEAFLNMCISTLMAAFYAMIFPKFKGLENYICTWIWLPICGIITGSLSILTEKISKRIEKINIKQILIMIIILIIVGSGIFVIGLNQKEPLTIYTTSKGQSDITRFVQNIQPNSIYKLKFEISAKTEHGFEIHIEEENKYDQKVNEYIIKFGNYEGDKQINIVTTEDTNRLKIRFLRKEKEENSELTIKKLEINNVEIGLNYRYLPMFIVNIVENITVKNKSVWERLVFIEDGLKIAKDNLLFGVGGNGWEYTYGKVQSYAYVAKQSHCFYTQVVIENGITGIIGVLGTISCLIYYSIKNKQRNQAMLCAIRSITITQHNRLQYVLLLCKTNSIHNNSNNICSI